MLRYSVGVWSEPAMSQDRSEITEQVVRFPPKQQAGNSADEAGQAVIAQIRKAAELTNENCDRAMALAHKLAMQLRAAEDRISQLEASTAKSSKSSSPRDRPFVPNKHRPHQNRAWNQASLRLLTQRTVRKLRTRCFPVGQLSRGRSDRLMRVTSASQERFSSCGYFMSKQ